MNIFSVNASAIYTVINLILLAALFKVFLFKRVDKIFEQRQNDADSLKKQSEDAVNKANELKEEYERKVKEQEKQVDSILAEAREKGYSQYNDIVETANKEAQAILDEAKMRAKADAERERAKYMADLTDVVIDAASKIAANSHTLESDKNLYDSFIDEALNSSDSND